MLNSGLIIASAAAGGTAASLRAFATGSVNTGRSVGVTIPASTVAGDMLLGVCASIGGSNESASGWTRDFRTSSGVSAFTVYCLFRRIAQAGDAGSTATFSLSPAADTSAGVVLLVIANPLRSTTHGHVSSAGSGTTLSTAAPSSVVVKKPSRVDVFAQGYASFESPIPSFSSYTGQGSLVASVTSNFNRLSVYFKNDALDYRSVAQVSSNFNVPFVTAAFNV